MKNKIYVFSLTLITSYVTFSQQNQTGTPPPNNTFNRALYAWYRGGNQPIGNNNNTFGTRWNSPIYTITNNITRSKLNGNVNYTINGYNGQRNGYMLLGTQTASNTVLYNGTRGPYSQLHLTGRFGGATQNGYRPWMQTGATFTAFNDIAYVGLRHIGQNVTEYTMAWGNNQNVNNGVEDDMVFRFVRGGNGNNAVGSYDTANDIDGRHIARFTSRGLMGLGNTFGVVNGIGSPYVRPKSLLHLSHTLRPGLAEERYGFMQITYRDNTNTIGTGQTQWDGLRLGIDNDVFNAQGTDYYNAYLRWQENSSFIIETDYNNIADDNIPTANAGEERIRVTNIFAPGVPNPLSNFAFRPSITRVGISALGQPLTEPRALLHIGVNIQNNLQGWRNWMDYGTFTNTPAQNESMYYGLIFSSADNDDRVDAVINWSDNQTDAWENSGLLRFVYTTNSNNANTNSEATNYYGLELMRMSPNLDVSTGTYGRVGIGDFTPTGNNSNPSEKLDVDGNGRFRFIPADTADCLILGLHNNNNNNDNTLRRLEFTGDTNDVLQGDGTWGPKQFPCWDINQNGVNDPNEDVNGDGVFNGLDCGTDDQIITNFAINGNTLTLTIENGNTVNVDLSQFLDNTDNQNLTSAVLDPNTNILTISIENGTPVSVDLSGIVGTTNITADNGLTLNNNNVQWGQLNTNGVSLNGGQLIHHTEIPMNNYNVLFSGIGSQLTNTMSIGAVNTGRAKLNVYSNSKNYGMYLKLNDNLVSVGPITTGQRIEVIAQRSVIGSDIDIDANSYTGGSPIYGQKITLNGGGTQFNYGSQINISTQQQTQTNYGLNINAYGNSNAVVGIKTVAQNGVSGNTGAIFIAQGNSINTNTGISAKSHGASLQNIGIVSDVIADGDHINVGIDVAMHDPNTFPTNNGGYANYAGRFLANQIPNGSNTIYGVYGQATGGQTGSNITGVSGYATGNGTVIGGSFSAQSSSNNGYSADAIYGIYASINPTGSTASYAGYFNGQVYINGTTYPSDINMKTNILNYDSSLYVINQLQPKTFEYTNANFQGMNLPNGHQYGLIAQEVEQILPTIVTDNTHPAEYDSLGNQIHPAYNFKGVDYTKLIPVLVGGIQEQQAIITTQDSTINVQDSLINDLNNRLTTLENCLGNLLPLLCQINNNMIQQNDAETQKQLNNMLNIELSDDTENIVLNQNVPNPFAEQTTITYTIPATVQKAQIHFYDQSGKLIRTVEITERGNGRINVFASDLSTGIYTYTLVADGQIIASKRMVKTN